MFNLGQILRDKLGIAGGQAPKQVNKGAQALGTQTPKQAFDRTIFNKQPLGERLAQDAPMRTGSVVDRRGNKLENDFAFPLRRFEDGTVSPTRHVAVPRHWSNLTDYGVKSSPTGKGIVFSKPVNPVENGQYVAQGIKSDPMPYREDMYQVPLGTGRYQKTAPVSSAVKVNGQADLLRRRLRGL